MARGQGPGTKKAARRLTPPARLSVRVATQRGEGHSIRVRLRGRLESGRVRVETLAPDRFHWMWEEGAAVSELVFASLESVELLGIPEETAWQVSGLDLEREDLTLLLPLWAGMVEPHQADEIIRQTLLEPNRFRGPGGLSSVPKDDPEYRLAAADPRGAVNPALNLMLGEALVRYGFRKEAAELLGSLLRDSPGLAAPRPRRAPGLSPGEWRGPGPTERRARPPAAVAVSGRPGRRPAVPESGAP